MAPAARRLSTALFLVLGAGGSATDAVDGSCKTTPYEHGVALEPQSLLQSKQGDRRATLVDDGMSDPGGGVTEAVAGAVNRAIAAVTGSGEAEHATQDHADWTYAATDTWAAVSIDCVGSEQSPVDIDTARVTEHDGLRSSLAPFLRYTDLGGLNLTNNGHALQVNGAFGALILPDGLYYVKQFHFHCPSEHALDGVLYPCELHIVHQHANATGTDRLAVIGVLFQDSELISSDLRQQFAAVIERQLSFLESLGFGSELPAVGQETALPAEFRPNLGQVFSAQLAGPFFHYQGSLTTPPCSESVHWYVLQRPAAVTTAMVERFKSLFPAPANNRPVQMLNGRVVVQGALETTPQEFAVGQAP